MGASESVPSVPGGPTEAKEAKSDAASGGGAGAGAGATAGSAQAENIGRIAAWLNGSLTPLGKWLKDSATPERLAAMVDIDRDGRPSAADLTTSLVALIQVVFARVDSNKNGRIDDHEVGALIALMIDGEEFSSLTRSYLDGLKAIVQAHLKDGSDLAHFTSAVISQLAQRASSSAPLPLALVNLLPFASTSGAEWKRLTGSDAVSALETEEEMQAKIKDAMEAALRAERQAAQRQAAPPTPFGDYDLLSSVGGPIGGAGYPLVHPGVHPMPVPTGPPPVFPGYGMRPELAHHRPEPLHHLRPERAHPPVRVMRPEMRPEPTPPPSGAGAGALAPRARSRSPGPPTPPAKR